MSLVDIVIRFGSIPFRFLPVVDEIEHDVVQLPRDPVLWVYVIKQHMARYEPTTNVVPINHRHVQKTSNSSMSIVQLRYVDAVDKSPLAVCQTSGVVMSRHDCRVHHEQ